MLGLGVFRAGLAAPVRPPDSPDAKHQTGTTRLAASPRQAHAPGALRPDDRCAAGRLVGAQRGRQANSVFGLELPALIGKNPPLAGEIKEWHELAGVVGYWLIGLHAAAALFHQFISRDNTVVRMLPGHD